MTEIIIGGDSRGWNGALPPGTAYRFWCIKMTQGLLSWLPDDVLKKQWLVTPNYGLNRLPFHYFSNPIWQDPVGYGEKQAKHLYNAVMALGSGLGELPPAIDLEERAGLKGKGIVKSMRACVEKTAEFFNKKVVIYSAGWFWDNWVYPYLDGWKPWETCYLWEADPLPDTTIKGDWPQPAHLTQIALDHAAPGFNAAIDTNHALRSWWDEVTAKPKPEPVPVPDPVVPTECKECQELKKRASVVVLAAVDLADLL